MQDTHETKQPDQEMKQLAMRKARSRANTERWDRNVTVFSFAILIIVIILLFQEVGMGIVTPVAVIGLATVWLAGWRQGRQLFVHFYSEELSKLEQASEEKVEEAEEETIEEKIRKAMRDMWR